MGDAKFGISPLEKNEQPAGRSLADPATKPHSTGERDTYLASTSTSAEEGVGPSDPNATRRSRRERANALAALQAKRQLQHHNHACRARLLVALGRPRTFALANCRRKSWHSSDHLPPTSLHTSELGNRSFQRNLCVKFFRKEIRFWKRTHSDKGTRRSFEKNRNGRTSIHFTNFSKRLKRCYNRSLSTAVSLIPTGQLD